MLKQKVKDRFQRSLVGNILKSYRIRKTFEKWVRDGRPKPVPHLVKQMVVKTFAEKHRPGYFIETGTYLGEMVSAVKDDFEKIYSVELSEELYEQALKKFSGYDHITIVHGDSARVLPEILRHVDAPCLFWLDGHFSAGITARGVKETPVWEELEHIFKHAVKGHVILIDDASLFNGQNDYPTLESIKALARSRLPGSAFEVREDVIRIYPSK